MSKIRRLCTMGAVLEDGRLTMYDDIEEAIAHHMRTLEHALGERAEDDPDDDD
jgi:capsular polysaccharide transport system ATP-binding protein